MKIKTIVILTLCLLLTSQVFASVDRTTMQERTDSWLRTGTPPPSITGDTPKSDPTLDSPIGDGIWLILGLGLAYGVYAFGKRKKAIV